MDNSKQKFKYIFDIDGKSTLNTAEKENLYKGIIKEAKRKRMYRFIWQASSVAAVLVLTFIVFYMNAKSTQSMGIKDIAVQNQGRFAESESIQIASLNVNNNTYGLTSLEERQVKEYQKLSIRTDNKKFHYSTLYIPYGKRQEVVLPDGSTVWLNAGSYLTYSNDMTHGDREVYLNGEGFFDIKHTGTRFTVRTSQADIQVLGTTFNASSYEDEATFSVELLTGKIELNSPESKFNTVAMRPGERVVINSQKNMLQKTNGVGDDMLWTKKQLALKNVKMGELLKRMERIYNVNINAAHKVYDMDINYSGRLNVGVDIVTSLSSIYELRNYDILLKEKEVYITEKQ